MPYIASTDIQDFLGIDLQTTGLTQVAALIPAIEGFMERACNRKWVAANPITETFDGGTDTFFPKVLPISTVLSISDNGDAVDAATIFVYGSYIKTSYRLTNLRRAVTIVYTSSVSLPADVKHAMVRWVAQIYKEAKDAGKPVSRVNMGPMAVEFLTKDGIPKFVEEVIARHRLRSV